MHEPFALALTSAAELRRRELPIAFALSIFGGAAAALVIGTTAPLYWTAIALCMFALDALLFRRLAEAEVSLDGRVRVALAFWAMALSATYVALPSMLWFDGRPATAAAAMALWCAGLVRSLSDLGRERDLAIASATPGALTVVFVPLWAATETKQIDFMLSLAAVMCGIALVIYATRFWLGAAIMNAQLSRALEDAEEKHSVARLMFEQSTMAACLYDRDMKIVAANARWREYFAPGRADVVGLNIATVLPGISDAWIDGLKRAMSGETFKFSDSSVQLLGGVRFFSGEVLPWRGPEGEIIGVMAYSQDVSEIVATRQRSAENEARLQLALDVSRSTVWEIDMLTGEITWDGDPRAVYGRVISIADLDAHASPLFLDEDRERLAEIFDPEKRPDQFAFDHRYIRPDGEIAWVQVAVRNMRNEQGVVHRVVVMSKDVSERKRSEQAFVDAMRRAEAALDAKGALIQGAAPVKNAPFDPVDEQKGGIVEMYARLGRLLSEIDARDAALASAMESMQAARESAVSASVAKSQFLANMSHELRTPLNAIIGYSEILLEEASADGRESDGKDIERVLAAARQLLHLINEILDLSKIEAGRMDVSCAEFGVDQFVEAAADTVRGLVEKNGNRFIVECAPDLGAAFTDSFKLSQCLLNLLSNAAKFTHEGEVALRARRERAADGDWLVMEVADTGIGMSEEEVARLFRPFMQADASTTRKYGGTGLGLAITRRMAQLLGGDVSVASRQGEGSVFILRAPAVFDGAEVQAAAQPASAPLQAANGRVVLVIDDEESARDLAARSLTRLGFDVRGAATAAEGEALAHALKPALILADIQLPDFSGWELIARLKQHADTKDVPILVHSVEDSRQRALAAGACDLLTKPADRDILAAAAVRFARGGAEPVNTSATNFAKTA